MPPTLSSSAASFQQRAGRSNVSPYYSNDSLSAAGSASKSGQPSATASISNSGDEHRAGALSSPKDYQRNGPRNNLRNIDTNMTSYTSTTTVPATKRSASGHAKLHKRGGSGSSLPGPPSPFNGAHSTYATPFATYEEPFPDVSSTPPLSSTPKIKPYLRKMGSAKDDQSKIDLSKSTAEHDRLAGLGIQDYATKSASDVSFAHTGRRTPHARTTSVGSQVSSTSGAKPFAHPMRQTPRPYTPPTGQSYASSLNSDEAHEISDIVDDDFRLGHGFRTRRSMSISSTPQIPPTPLSQSITTAELGIVPKLTTLSNMSQSNLSVKSAKSAKSSKSRLGRSRGDTGRSMDNPTSPSSRTSFDKAFSFVSRKSDTDPQNRDERIRAARQKFNEKEANKDRKLSKEAQKRQQRQRTRSDVSERSRKTRPSTSHTGKKSNLKHSEKDNFDSRPYEAYRPSNEASLPIQGRSAGSSEKTPRVPAQRAKPPSSGWQRLSTWFQTRMLSCGGRS